MSGPRAVPDRGVRHGLLLVVALVATVALIGLATMVVLRIVGVDVSFWEATAVGVLTRLVLLPVSVQR